MTTMNTLAIINSLDIPLERWLQYAFVSIADFILSAIVIIIATVVLYVGVAHLWGKCWNKDWSVTRKPIMVVSLALISALCLAAGDSLCNGGFNVFSKVAGEITPAFNGDVISRDDSPIAYKLVTNLVRELHLATLSDSENVDEGAVDSEEPKYAVMEMSAKNYVQALFLLRIGVPVLSLIALLLVTWSWCLGHINTCKPGTKI